jgi:hypothetical protein
VNGFVGNTNSEDSGVSYVVFGRAGGFAPVLALAGQDGSIATSCEASDLFPEIFIFPNE